MAGKVRHLLERDGRHYARVAVPPELRNLVGKRELTKALGADRSEALRRLPGAVAAMQVTIVDARHRASNGSGKPVPRAGAPLTAREMAAIHYQDQERFDEEARNADHRFPMGFPDEQYVAALRAAMTGGASNDELQQTVGLILRKFQARGNTDAEPGTPEWRELARALAVAEYEALKRTAERDEGDFSGKPAHPVLADKPEAQPAQKDALAIRIMSPESTKALSTLLPMFAKEKGAKASTTREYAVAVRMFEEHLGEARPVYKITRQDVIAYKNALLKTPANYTKRFPGLTLPQAIAANEIRKQPFPALRPKTINDKALPWINSVLKWCVNNGIIPDNPAAGIKIERKRLETAPPREHFTPGDLARIFSPPEFAPDGPLLERDWAMLIALFSGMRAGEIAQIKLDSVRTERGILVFAIEEQTKTRGSRRITPVHSTLIRLGLSERITELRRNRQTHLFPEWFGKAQARIASAREAGRDVNTPYSQVIPRWFNRTYLPSIGIHDDRKVFHCFRHTLKTALSRAGVSRSISDDITGHEDSTAGGKYIHENSIEAMKEAIERVRFDGFPLALGQ
jgi:integrase